MALPEFFKVAEQETYVATGSVRAFQLGPNGALTALFESGTSLEVDPASAATLLKKIKADLV